MADGMAKVQAGALALLVLIVVIQGSIWINFSVPTIQHESLYFLGYLIVNSIQMLSLIHILHRVQAA